MIRLSTNGKLYWLGNISATPPAGNSPRYPLVIAEVDDRSGLLKKDTVTLIDDRQPGQGDTQFSIFPLMEDRQTHVLVLHVTTFGQEPKAQDWATADNYRYTLTLQPSAAGLAPGLYRADVNVVSPFGDLGPAGPQPKSRPFRVAAIFYSGMYEYDSKFAYLDLGEAQRFFGTGDAVTGLELKVKDVDAARAVMGRVVFELGGWPFRAKDWGELNRSLFSALQMEKVVMAVILGFIVLVASFIIVATLIMLVLEKTKEIAVLKSMGAGVPSVMKIFVAEGVIIGAIGTAFGLILGYGTCLLVDRVGIPLDPEVYYISNLPVLIEPAQFGLVALAALALSYLATIYPATKAARLRPVDGLRAE